MIHASVFSGIGGPEVAAQMMGWENAFHCEINPFGRSVLGYWFPESKSYEDITKTSFKEWRGRIDVLTGGFPCQPFSYAGKRGGRNDDRYLWPEMFRVIDEVRPSWVVCENVAGITTMVEGGVLTPLGCDSSLFAEGDELHRYELDQTFTIERISEDLEGIGYSVQSVLVPAAAVGAPHRRDRVYIIAHYDARHPDNGTNHRPSGEDEGAEKEERLPERDNLHLVGDSSEVRSTMRQYAADTECRGSRTLPAQVHTGVADGDEPHRDGCVRTPSDTTGELRDGDSFGDGLQPRTGSMPEPGDSHREDDAPHANGTGREEPQSTGRGEDCPEEGAWVHDRTERSRGNGDTTDSVCERLEGEDKSGSDEGGERMCVRRDLTGYDWEGLRPERRWREFPTVPPIHRRDDGIPIRMDNLSISFTKWRTESLKAYGNAIVPQVMYRIFQAIEFAEANSKTDINF